MKPSADVARLAAKMNELRAETPPRTLPFLIGDLCGERAGVPSPAEIGRAALGSLFEQSPDSAAKLLPGGLVDASDDDVDGRIAAVRGVLGEIDAGTIPEQLVFTKSDAVDAATLADLLRAHPDAVAVSARSGDGVDALLDRLGDRLRALTQIVELRIPYERGDVLPALHREGDVIVTVHDDDGTRVRARLPDAVVGRFADLVVAVDDGAAGTNGHH